MPQQRRKLTEAEKERNKIIREANKRLRMLEERDLKSPAFSITKSKLETLGSKGGYFSVKGKSPIVRKHIVKLAKHFLDLPTSTVEGAEKANKKRREAFAERFGLSFDEVEVIETVLSYLDSRVGNDYKPSEVIMAMMDTFKSNEVAYSHLTTENVKDIYMTAFSYLETPTTIEEIEAPHFIVSNALDLAEAWVADAVGRATGWTYNEFINEILRDVPNPARNGKYYMEK